MNNLVPGTNNVRFLSSFIRREETVFHCISLHPLHAAAFTGAHAIFNLFIYYLLCFIITRIMLPGIVKEQDCNREQRGLWRKSWKMVQLAPASCSHVLKLKTQLVGLILGLLALATSLLFPMPNYKRPKCQYC